jgi:AcrR family transcriptional regulator
MSAGNGEGAGEAARARRRGDQLPAGRHGLSPEFVAESQRARLIDAMARAVAEKGYLKTSVADVLALAGVSRRTFYEQFDDKEECFVAAYSKLAGDLLAAVANAYASQSEWPDRVAAGIRRLVRFVASDSAYARFAIVEVLAAGPEALRWRDGAVRAFETFFDESRPEVPRHGLPTLVAQATVGGIYELMYTTIIRDGAERLAEIEAELAYLALAPYMGHAEARARAGISS